MLASFLSEKKNAKEDLDQRKTVVRKKYENDTLPANMNKAKWKEFQLADEEWVQKKEKYDECIAGTWLSLK